MSYFIYYVKIKEFKPKNGNDPKQMKRIKIKIITSL